MNCVIVDANAQSRTTLSHLASKIGYLNIVAECGTGSEALQIGRLQQLDLLFIDVDIPDMNGLDLARQFGPRMPIVVLTALRRDYAADAFELNVADYMLKPFTAGRFLQAMEKVRQIHENNAKTGPSCDDDHLFIRERGMLKRVRMEDIEFLEAKGDYVKVVARQKFHVVHMKFSSIANRLPADRFLRVHRSYIIAVNKVDRIEEGDIMINNRPIPVADSCRSALKKRLNII